MNAAPQHGPEPLFDQEYLNGPREQSHHPDRKEVTVGDIVVVNDPGHPRTFWKLARVTGLLRKSDSQVRGVGVQVGSTRSMLRLLIQALYPLEVHSSQFDQPIDSESASVLRSEVILSFPSCCPGCPADVV